MQCSTQAATGSEWRWWVWGQWWVWVQSVVGVGKGVDAGGVAAVLRDYSKPIDAGLDLGARKGVSCVCQYHVQWVWGEINGARPIDSLRVTWGQGTRGCNLNTWKKHISAKWDGWMNSERGSLKRMKPVLDPPTGNQPSVTYSSIQVLRYWMCDLQ